MQISRLSLLISAILSLAGSQDIMGQCPSGLQINSSLNAVLANSDLSANDKLKELTLIRTRFDKCKIQRDSVYAKLLHNIGLHEYIVNNYHPTPGCIKHTLESVRINTSGTLQSDPVFATRSYNNIAKFFFETGLVREALKYYDSTLQFALRFPAYQHIVLVTRYSKINALFKLGDYQASAEDATIGIEDAQQRRDSFYVLSFINQRAQAFLFQHLYQRAAADAAVSIQYAEQMKNRYLSKHQSKVAEADLQPIYYELANAYKNRALSIVDTANFKQVNDLISKAINYRMKSADPGAIADDYNDYGYYFFTHLKDYNRAKINYLKSIQFSGDSRKRLAFAHLNIGAANFKQGNNKEAEKNYMLSLQDVSLNSSGILSNPGFIQISLVEEKEFVHVFLNNKTEYLLHRYRQTKEPSFLKACLETALLTDSVIKSIRHDQTAEQSKLFWRKRTREFFTNALDASFLSNDPQLAFHFMESSRAVILGDKINELGASLLLPVDQILHEQNLRETLVHSQQELSSKKEGTEEYRKAHSNLLQTKQELGRFVKSLEKNYPSYYQYKYADVVPSLDDLKKYLSANQQSFVHYFMGDTVSYVLGISANNVKMLRVRKEQFAFDQITELLRFFSDKQLMNTQHGRFTALSHQVNKALFEPLQLPKGRVVICPDNFLLPFEALSTDATGNRMLINDYAFSYIYSAGYLLRRFPEYPAKGNFIGFAPVSFRADMKLGDLKKSASSLANVADNYSNVSIYKTTEATKRNFLSNIGNYNIVNVFSHARAEEGDDEPVLYMQDSIIGLSELQYLNRPCTKLIVLSACQTTVGKNATGEGIYSLARGFAAAGIPSVAATVWKADEETIYYISRLFHQYLSQGIRKDEALQKAKLGFMRGADREQMLPYYWANMIIMGNPEPVTIIEKSFARGWILAVLAGAILIFYLLYKKPWIKSATKDSHSSLS